MAQITSRVRFQAKLLRPGGADRDASWTFLNLPQVASDRLPARSMVSVEGTFNGHGFQTTLLPDGNGGHWLKVKPELREAAQAEIGQAIAVEIAPVKTEPEPEIPEDFQSALDAAGPKALETWVSITAVARRDWAFWIVSGKKAETRIKRIEVAIDKLSKGNRRPCCFDRSGMYDKSLSCPVADGD